MKTPTFHLPMSASRALAMTTLVAAFALGHATPAVADDTAQASTAKGAVVTDPTASPMPLGAAHHHRVAKAGAAAETVETRIKYLHDKFAILPAQEDNWNKVAATMRDNADKITGLVKTRADSEKTMTAVDDLKSYAEISGAHEDGTRKLIPVFQALYESMSDAQKLTADTEFRGHGRHKGAHGHAVS